MVPFDNYFIGPREDVLRENVLKPNEIMTRGLDSDAGGGHEDGLDEAQGSPGLRLRRGRRSRSRSRPSGGKWTDGRVVLGGVSPVPYRAKVVEDALKGQDVKSAAKAAAAQIRTVARPMS